MIKVAVTSTTLMDQKPIVLANYNRPDFRGYGKIWLSATLVIHS